MFALDICLDGDSWLTVVALPPIESSSSNQEVEEESEDEPEGVLSCVVSADVQEVTMRWRCLTRIRWRDIACRIEEDGDVDEPDPGVWESSVSQVHEYCDDRLWKRVSTFAPKAHVGDNLLRG